jgi:Fungal specific transcription factor domain
VANRPRRTRALAAVEEPAQTSRVPPASVPTESANVAKSTEVAEATEVISPTVRAASAVLASPTRKSRTVSPIFNVGFTLPARLQQSAHDISLNYFVTFCAPDSHFYYVPDMLGQLVPSSSKCLHSSIHAVSLALIACEKRDGQQMLFARSAYIKAIKDLNMALRSDQLVNENATLVATLILSVFEAVVAESGSSLDSWIAHANGTISLLQHRGMQLLRTDFGLKIFIQVASNVRANCAQRFLPLSPAFVELDKQVRPLLDMTKPPTLYWPVIDLAIDIQTKIRRKKIYPCTQY